jgi:hypothetical protein
MIHFCIHFHACRILIGNTSRVSVIGPIKARNVKLSLVVREVCCEFVDWI